MTANERGASAEYRPARTRAEVDIARELIFKSFGPSYFEIKDIKDLQAAAEPDQHDSENYVLAVMDGAVVGTLHYYPQEVSISGVKARIATLAEFCVTPEAARQFVGLALLSRTLELIAARGFPICIGAARRAMDDYYRRVGFSGVGAYCRVEIEKPCHARHRGSVTLRPFNGSHVPAYDAAHRATYEGQSCFFPRAEGRWGLIGELARRGLGPRFAEFGPDDDPSGYVIWDGEALLEVAFRRDDVDLPSILDVLPGTTDRPISSLLLSFRHPVLSALADADLSLTHRRIPHAGQIAKILDRDAFLQLARQVFTSRMRHARLPAFQLAHDGVRFDWTDSSGLRIDADSNAMADRRLLWLFFRGVDSVDALSLCDPAWTAAFPEQHFTWSVLDGG